MVLCTLTNTGGVKGEGQSLNPFLTAQDGIDSLWVLKWSSYGNLAIQKNIVATEEKSIEQLVSIEEAVEMLMDLIMFILEERT